MRKIITILVLIVVWIATPLYAQDVGLSTNEADYSAIVLKGRLSDHFYSIPEKWVPIQDKIVPIVIYYGVLSEGSYYDLPTIDTSELLEYRMNGCYAEEDALPDQNILVWKKYTYNNSGRERKCPISHLFAGCEGLGAEGKTFRCVYVPVSLTDERDYTDANIEDVIDTLEGWEVWNLTFETGFGSQDNAETPFMSIRDMIDRADDSDGDSVPDDFDNCIGTANYEQIDRNGDGIGDECEDGEGPEEEDPDGDNDEDGVPNIADNCKDIENPEQEDFDEDNIGDVCDACPLYFDETNESEACIDAAVAGPGGAGVAGSSRRGGGSCSLVSSNAPNFLSVLLFFVVVCGVIARSVVTRLSHSQFNRPLK